MIPLTDAHYAAIGRVAVESCTLDREVREYLTRLGAAPPPRAMLGHKLRLFKELLGRQPLAAQGATEFSFALTKIDDLIDKRNALAHGVWMSDPGSADFDDTIVQGQSATLKARDIADVAARIRTARKLLLRLCHDHCAVAAGAKKCPAASTAKLMRQL